MLRIKTLGHGAFRGEPVKDNQQQPRINLRKRKAVKVEPITLVGFTVAWQANPNCGANHISFRLDITATFSAPVDPDRITYRQYTRDRCSIAQGTDPGNIQFTTTRFELDNYTVDHENGSVEQDGVLRFQDNPGYTPAYGLDTTTDIHYTFGAYWEIELDGVPLLATPPLFAIAFGRRRTVPFGGNNYVIGRFYFPNHLNAATWDFTNNVWNQTLDTLTAAWPALPIGYPVPQVVDP